MSAVRRTDRRSTRNHQSSPYTRPATPKKSSWSISGLLNYIFPARSRAPVVEMLPEGYTATAESLSARGHRIQTDINSSNPTPPNTAIQGSFHLPALSNQASNGSMPSHNETSLPPGPVTPSPSKNLETVAAFLAQKAGKPLNQIEAAGLVALINQSTDHNDKPEPFRFSSVPSTPIRGSTPNIDFSTPDTSNTSDSPSPRKTLSKNPNGVYRWEGGGSARPRSRYRSPAFGSPPSISKIKLSSPETPNTDTKRRRVGDDASNVQHISLSSTPPQRSAAPSPPSRPGATPTYPFPVSNGTSSTVNGSSVNGVSLPRLRITGFPVKPTTPVIPSPLRQAWSQSESPPSTKPTKAADFMTELLKEVTPPRKPDVANPYQTASPVKPPPKKSGKRPRATGKPSAPPTQLKESGPEFTPQAIIEATVPKGSKRSRPPPNIENLTLPKKKPEISLSTADTPDNLRPEQLLFNNKAKSPEIRGGPSPIVVENLDDAQEHKRTAKRQKIPTVENGTGRDGFVTIEEIGDDETTQTSIPIRPSEIIEVDQVDMKSTQPTISGTPQNIAGPSSSNTSRSPFGNNKSSTPKEPSKLRFSYQPDASPGTLASVENAKQDPKAVALAMAVDDLPSFSFKLGVTTSFVAVAHVAERNAVKAISVSSLPKFDFCLSFATKNVDTGTSVSFNWAAAGMKPPTKLEGDSWTCSLCMLVNPGSALDTCTVCDAPRPGSQKTVAPVGFNWSAAGMKPPSAASGGIWTCSVCLLSNPATAVDKCTVCDSPR